MGKRITLQILLFGLLLLWILSPILSEKKDFSYLTGNRSITIKSIEIPIGKLAFYRDKGDVFVEDSFLKLRVSPENITCSGDYGDLVRCHIHIIPEFKRNICLTPDYIDINKISYQRMEYTIQYQEFFNESINKTYLSDCIDRIEIDFYEPHNKRGYFDLATFFKGINYTIPEPYFISGGATAWNGTTNNTQYFAGNNTLWLIPSFTNGSYFHVFNNSQPVRWRNITITEFKNYSLENIESFRNNITTDIQAIYHFSNNAVLGENLTQILDYSVIDGYTTVEKNLSAQNTSDTSYFNVTDGIIGKAMGSDNTNYNTAYHGGNDFKFAGHGTTSFWVYRKKTVTTTYYQIIGSTTGGYTIRDYTSTGVRFYLKNSSNYRDVQGINYNEWTHVLFAYGGGQGEQEGSLLIMINGYPAVNETNWTVYNSTGTYLRIFGATATTKANVTIDELYIWNRTLSYEEGLELYYAGYYGHLNTECTSDGINYTSFNTTTKYFITQSDSNSLNCSFKFWKTTQQNSPEIINVTVGYDDISGGGGARFNNSITLHNPLNNTAILTNFTSYNVSFNFTALSNMSQLINCSLLINQSFISNINNVSNNTRTTFHINMSTFNVSINWSINCSDGYGLFNSSLFNFSIMNTSEYVIPETHLPPEIFYFYPAPVVFWNFNNFSINCTPIGYSTLSNISIYWDSILNYSSTSPKNLTMTTFNYSVVPEGNYTVFCNVFDNYSQNVNSTQTVLILDYTPPINPLDLNNASCTNTSIYWTYTFAPEYLDCNIWFNISNNVSNNVTNLMDSFYNLTIPALNPNTTYQANIICRDFSGNYNYSVSTRLGSTCEITPITPSLSDSFSLALAILVVGIIFGLLYIGVRFNNQIIKSGLIMLIGWLCYLASAIALKIAEEKSTSTQLIGTIRTLFAVSMYIALLLTAIILILNLKIYFEGVRKNTK